MIVYKSVHFFNFLLENLNFNGQENPGKIDDFFIKFSFSFQQYYFYEKSCMMDLLSREMHFRLEKNSKN